MTSSPRLVQYYFHSKAGLPTDSSVIPARDQRAVAVACRVRLSDLDRHGVPAFLQASSRQSRTLYERHGYEMPR